MYTSSMYSFIACGSIACGSIDRGSMDGGSGGSGSRMMIVSGGASVFSEGASSGVCFDERRRGKFCR